MGGREEERRIRGGEMGGEEEKERKNRGTRRGKGGGNRGKSGEIWVNVGAKRG